MPLLHWNLIRESPEVVPHTVLSSLRDWFCQANLRDLLSMVDLGVLAKGELDEPRLCLGAPMMKRWRDKSRYCAYPDLASTVENWRSVPLPKFFFLLYYVTRPVHRIGPFEQGLLRRIVI